jgi:DNA polymerase-3 subunit delta
LVKTSDAVLKELKAGKYEPVYFLHGEEAYHIDTITDYIEQHALTPAERGFNQVMLYGRETDMHTILNQARRFPMMASRQVVIVKELQQMPDWTRGEAQELLRHYLEKPQQTTVLVLNYKYKSIAKNTKVYKALDKHGIVIESKKLYDNQVGGWVLSYLKERNFNIEPAALALLVEAIGADLSKLHQELDKLLLNQNPSQAIRAAVIEKNVGISRDFNVFEFQKAIAEKNALKIEQIIRYWAANPKKQPLIPTIALLYNFFAKTLIAYHQKDRSDQALSSALKVNPFFLKDYKLMMQNYSLAKMLKAIEFLRHADLQSKGIAPGGTSEADILREFSVKMLSI